MVVLPTKSTSKLYNATHASQTPHLGNNLIMDCGESGKPTRLELASPGTARQIKSPSLNEANVTISVSVSARLGASLH